MVNWRHGHFEYDAKEAKYKDEFGEFSEIKWKSHFYLENSIKFVNGLIKNNFYVILLFYVDHQILWYVWWRQYKSSVYGYCEKLLISAGTVHVIEMEDAGIIMGSSLVLDYDKLGYSLLLM
jgi:hypothetical protein